MGNRVKKFTWVIQNFSSLQFEEIFSDQFVVGGCKWRLLAFPNAYNKSNNLSLCLEVAEFESLPSGWRRQAKVSFTIVNQLPHKLSQHGQFQKWFDEESTDWGFPSMFPHNDLHAKDSGFLLNGELKIVAEIDVLEVIGKLDVTTEISSVKKSMDVNGFRVFPSQVETVKRIFERHPDFASKLGSKNRHLKSTYINVLLGLIETLCQPPQELSNDDLDEASIAVSYVEKGGFKVDLLEKKLEEVKEKKMEANTAKARLQQMEEELQTLNKKCLDLKALIEKENADVSEANVPLSFDDVI